MPSRLVLSALVLAIGLHMAAVRSAAPPAEYQATAKPAAAAEPVVALPNARDSLKIGVLGDFGTGSTRQYETAAQMVRTHETFPYELVLTTGDNLYGWFERRRDFEQKFEKPYKPLLDGGVKFYASLGNHDSREQRNYPLFNMNGKLYYSFRPSGHNVRFFALNSNDLTMAQIGWLEQELKASQEDWKVVYLHYPLYSSGERHGTEVWLHQTLEPLLGTYNVSIVFSGHDHFYERIRPQRGISYFVVGSGGQLRKGNIDPATGLTLKGFDADNAFLVGEFIGGTFTFQAISRTGAVVDSGVITRRQPSLQQ
jgi:hypothetical protein